MFLALPVTPTSVGGIPTLVEDITTGLLVSAGDSQALAQAIRRLADSPELRSRFGRAGRLRAVMDCQPERTARRYVSLCRRLVEMPRLDSRSGEVGAVF